MLYKRALAMHSFNASHQFGIIIFAGLIKVKDETEPKNTELSISAMTLPPATS